MAICSKAYIDDTRIVLIHRFGDGVNLLPLRRCQCDGLDCTDPLRTSWKTSDRGGGAFCFAFGRIIEESLGYRMLQRTHVLTSQAVVGDPRFVVVVFGPAEVSDVANVHVDSGELDASDHAPAVDRLSDGMKQAVAQAWGFDHVRLVLRQAVVAFSCCKPAPKGGG